ncbi:uncharacterized protein IL334_003078 [Kwoniella shivajii]|uniref:Uncharacterized protein n=1 Tax=Kwoniella shivajii TaxID=564305 RepID=A0ABZ1CY81_9TREE|nr:hypothetical protein IL334_003078 [Kwoniella shivajii]
MSDKVQGDPKADAAVFKRLYETIVKTYADLTAGSEIASNYYMECTKEKQITDEHIEELLKMEIKHKELTGNFERYAGKYRWANNLVRQGSQIDQSHIETLTTEHEKTNTNRNRTKQCFAASDGFATYVKTILQSGISSANEYIQERTDWRQNNHGNEAPPSTDGITKASRYKKSSDKCTEATLFLPLYSEPQGALRYIIKEWQHVQSEVDSWEASYSPWIPKEPTLSPSFSQSEEEFGHDTESLPDQSNYHKDGNTPQATVSSVAQAMEWLEGYDDGFKIDFGCAE